MEQGAMARKMRATVCASVCASVGNRHSMAWRDSEAGQ
jgi:hypothetical protein